MPENGRIKHVYKPEMKVYYERNVLGNSGSKLLTHIIFK